MGGWVGGWVGGGGGGEEESVRGDRGWSLEAWDKAGGGGRECEREWKRESEWSERECKCAWKGMKESVHWRERKRG